MRHRYGKFYADWRDEKGTRHMKAFPTKKKARATNAQLRAFRGFSPGLDTDLD